jgi:hypothetical protein
MKATNKAICISAYIRNIKFTYTILGAHNHKNTLGSDTSKSSQGNTETNSGSAGDVQDELAYQPLLQATVGQEAAVRAVACTALVGHHPACPAAIQPTAVTLGDGTARSPHSR